jgi:hypothetical protein
VRRGGCRHHRGGEVGAFARGPTALTLLSLMRVAGAFMFALLGALVPAPVAAGAHGSTPWFGSYQVSVAGGSQDATWTLNHPATSSCDISSTGQGTDDQDFLTGSPQTVQMSGVGPNAFPGTISDLPLNYTESREGSISESAPAGANTPECPGASGGGENTPVTPDCGTRSLSTTVEVDPSPTSPSISESPAASLEQEPPYKDCPVSGEVVPAFASPLVASLPPLGPAADGGAPSGIATLQASEPITEQDVTGQTTLKLELQFTRLFVIDAMGMPADANMQVGASGATTVPISCPAGSCSGSLGLELGGFASQSSRQQASAATSPPRFPAPVTTPEPAIASARFHLRAGHRGVVVNIPGGRRFARSLASTTFDIVVSEGSGRDTVRYVAGEGHLRP